MRGHVAEARRPMRFLALAFVAAAFQVTVRLVAVTLAPDGLAGHASAIAKGWDGLISDLLRGGARSVAKRSKALAANLLRSAACAIVECCKILIPDVLGS
jgi:hypothetical protein